MVNLLGGRAASAVMGIFMLAMGSSAANAQDYKSMNVSSAVSALDVDSAARPFGTAGSVASALARPAVATTTAVASVNGTVFQSQPAQSVTLQFSPSIAIEAAWLYRSGWPLNALVDRYSAGSPLDEQANCLATAVYFEARGESVEGQLAVARVVMNRAASGRYPGTWCNVVKQHAQFSFVRHGEFPSIDAGSSAWARAQGIARLAMANVVPSVGSDVLWYHADYVAPSWGHRMNVAEKIGAHIFYRA